MRQLLGVLTSDSGQTVSPPDRAPGLRDLAELIENLEAGGVPIDWLIDINPATVSPTIQLCAYRITQEAFTNAVKHAPGASIQLSVSAEVGAGDVPGLRLRVRTLGGEMLLNGASIWTWSAWAFPVSATVRPRSVAGQRPRPPVTAGWSMRTFR
jgi:hypothetical protein